MPGPRPFGSGHIERSFVEHLARAGVEAAPTPFDGRSDYGPFIAVGIPAGGLFTGAELVDTEEQAARWGGEAGVAFDPCYHAACDSLFNIDRQALAVNADALAAVLASYASSTADVNGIGDRAVRLVASEAVAATAVAPLDRASAARALSGERDRLVMDGTAVHRYIAGRVMDPALEPEQWSVLGDQPPTTRDRTVLVELAAVLGG